MEVFVNFFEQALYSTVRIECLDDDGNLNGIGTGFFVQQPVASGVRIHLVSNKHVLCGCPAIRIALTGMKDGEPDNDSSVSIPIGQVAGNVVQHPDPKVDIAVLTCTGIFNLMPNKLYFKAIGYDMLATFEEPELSVAEGVYFVGYPDNRYDMKHNLPLVRTGIVASNPRLDYNGIPCFVIDAQVFPGSSGSPVFVDLSFENIRNGVLSGGGNVKMLGIVASTLIRNNRLEPVQAAAIGWGTQEVLGLGIVFKATALKYLIDRLPV